MQIEGGGGQKGQKTAYILEEHPRTQDYLWEESVECNVRNPKR